MKRICIHFGIAIVLFGASVARTEASILSSLLSFDGVPDVLDDESRSKLNDADHSGTISVGDGLFGWVKISNVNGNAVSAAQNLVFAFSAEIATSPAVGGPSGLYTLRAPTNPLFTLSALLNNGNGLSALTSNPNSIFAIMESSTVNPLTNLTFTPGVTALNQMKQFDTSNWTFDALGGIVSATDFFQGALTIIPTVIVQGDEAGGFTVISSPGLPAGTTFLPVPSLHTLLDSFPTVTFHDVSLNFGQSTITSNKSGQNIIPWDFTDNSQFTVNATAVPEPASLLIWGALVSVLGFAAYYKRQKVTSNLV